MYCTNCGTKLDDNQKFCHNCGAQIVATYANKSTIGQMEIPVPPARPAASDAAAPIAPVPPQPQATPQPVQPKPLQPIAEAKTDPDEVEVIIEDDDEEEEDRFKTLKWIGKIAFYIAIAVAAFMVKDCSRSQKIHNIVNRASRY